MMDGLTMQRKQIESFEMTNFSMRGNFADRTRFPRYSSQFNFDVNGALKRNTEYVQSDDTSTFAAPTGDDKWVGGVLAPDGYMIYCVPFQRISIGKIDTKNESFAEFGSFPPGGTKWIGGVLVGNHIYCAPYGRTDVLKIDTRDDSIELFGNITAGGSTKFQGAVLAPNGLIYLIPFSHPYVLKIDPKTDTIIQSESLFISTATNKFTTGCIYGNYIYCGTNNGQILKIDTVRDSYQIFEFGSSTYSSIIAHPNGKIYALPLTSRNVLVIDPITDTFKTIGVNLHGYQGGCIGANGFIYAAPRLNQTSAAANTTILKVDPYTDTVTQFGSIAGGNVNRYAGAVLTKTGCVYFVPRTLTTVLKVGNPLPDELDTNYLCSRYVNKF